MAAAIGRRFIQPRFSGEQKDVCLRQASVGGSGEGRCGFLVRVRIAGGRDKGRESRQVDGDGDGERSFGLEEEEEEEESVFTCEYIQGSSVLF